MSTPSKAVGADIPVMGEIAQQRIISFDLLRGLAALGVAIPHFFLLQQHSSFWESVSIIAVEIFFALSGFVLAPQVLYLHKHASNYNLWVFFLRRWIRTITPYLIALILIAFLTANLFSPQFLKKALFLDTFISVPAKDFFAISWSLAVEEWYYITAALLVFIFRKTRVGTLFMAAIAVLFAVKIAGMFYDPNWETSVRRATMYRLDAIAFGFIMFLLKDRLTKSWLLTLIGTIATLAFTVALLQAFKAGAGGHTRIWMLFAIYALSAFSLLVVHLTLLLNPLIYKLKLERISQFLGEISYPVYLFHLPFGYAMLALRFRPTTAIILSIIGTVLFAYLFHVLVEHKLIHGRPRYKEKLSAEALADKSTLRPWSILRGWGMWIATLVFVVGATEVLSQAYLKNRHPKLVNSLFHTDVDQNKRGTMHILGALDPQLGYAHPKRIAQETKKYSVSQSDGYGVHRPKKGDHFKIFVLGGSTSDPFLAIKKKEPPWTKYLYTECRKLRNCGVWNAGVGGYGSPQELIRLVRDVVPQKPDLVISLHGPNELNRMRRAPFTTGFSNDQIKAEAKKGKVWFDNWWPNTLAALAIIRRNDDSPARSREIHYGYNQTKQSAFEMWKNNVVMMHAVSESQGIQYFTVLQPLVGYGDYEAHKDILKASKRGNKYYASVAAFYEEATAYCNSVAFCIDLSHSFDGRKEALFTDIRHPNDAGNKIIALDLSKILRSQGVLTDGK